MYGVLMALWRRRKTKQLSDDDVGEQAAGPAERSGLPEEDIRPEHRAVVTTFDPSKGAGGFRSDR